MHKQIHTHIYIYIHIHQYILTYIILSDGTRVNINPDTIRLVKLKCGIDKELTTIDESSSAVLKYRTPHFRLLLLYIYILIMICRYNYYMPVY